MGTMEQPTASSSTTDIQETTSITFPAGQGDITLITIDNVVFHVHRAVLRHSSHVFETILETGERDDHASYPPRLKIEAEASTLDHLLMFAYPNKLSPSIQDVNVLAAVFRAAKRYEMDGVQQQLRKNLTEVRIVDDLLEPPLYIKAPLAVLVISHAFDCEAEGRLALRECIKGSLEEHTAGASNFDIPAELLSEILRLRHGRLAWFVGMVNAIPWDFNTSCTYCGYKQHEWRGQIIHDLPNRLRFDNFRTTISEPIEICAGGHDMNQTLTHDTIDSWSIAARSIEEAIPALPHLSR